MFCNLKKTTERFEEKNFYVFNFLTHRLVILLTVLLIFHDNDVHIHIYVLRFLNYMMFRGKIFSIAIMQDE